MKYKVGEKVWHAGVGQEKKAVQCPICYGKKAVVLTLGNGDAVEMQCETCATPFDGPAGYIEIWEQKNEPEEVTIEKVRVEYDGKIESAEYYTRGNHILYERDLFSNKAEAEARCAEKIIEIENINNAQRAGSKKSGMKKIAWTSGYHLEKARQAQKDLDYHTKKATLLSVKEMMEAPKA